MKFRFILLIAVSFLWYSKNLRAQEFDMGETNTETTPTSSEDADSLLTKYGIGGGGTTINGQNFQQINFRLDVPVGKFGFGLDILLNIDADGQIRKEDWDEWQDYLDKFYYIRYGFKGDPFYIKLGGMDYSYLGYANVINGYTNMIEYPTVKRWGFETSFYFGNTDKNGKRTKKIGAEIFVNDIKEMFQNNASILFGTRLSYRPFWKFELGATYATDFNEYNGLKDFDDDGYPNEVDFYPSDDAWATKRDALEYALTQEGYTIEAATGITEALVAINELDPRRKDELFDINKNKSQSQVWSVDAGFPLIEKPRIKLGIYSHYTKIVNYGWGVTVPGLRFEIGQNGFLVFTAEYRRASSQFMFGFYDYTYELERAIFSRNTTGELDIITKQDRLKLITDEQNGFFVGLDINIFRLVVLHAAYQDLRGDDVDQKSIKGELNFGAALKAKIPVDAKGYYYQNNVQDFTKWKTPSTVCGYTVSYNVKGVDIGFDYRYTFQDLDGDGIIKDAKETIKTMGILTKVTF